MRMTIIPNTYQSQNRVNQIIFNYKYFEHNADETLLP